MACNRDIFTFTRFSEKEGVWNGVHTIEELLE
jgi:hypothetical protein